MYGQYCCLAATAILIIFFLRANSYFFCSTFAKKPLHVTCQIDICIVVKFKSYSKKTFSESLRGCYPIDKSLPGLSGSLIPQKPNCVFLPKRRSPVKVS